MFKLLRANLVRLKKDKVFWFALILMLAYSVYAVLSNGRQVVQMQYQDYEFLDNLYFDLAPMVGIFFAVIISLYLGKEYGDGTLRNKIIVGHSRLNIYMANLLTSFLIALSFVAVWLIGGLAGRIYMKEWRLSLSWTLLYVLMVLLLNFVLAAIFTLVGMLTTNKAATAIITILLLLLLLVGALIIYSRLAEPETTNGVVITSEGMQWGEPEVNPYYIGGTKRVIYEKALRILPTGQAILIANREITEAVFPLVSSGVLLLIFSGTGIVLFKRKDLK